MAKRWLIVGSLLCFLGALPGFLRCASPSRKVHPGGAPSTGSVWVDKKKEDEARATERLRRQFFSTYRFIYVKPSAPSTHLVGCCWWRRKEVAAETLLSFLSRKLSTERRFIQTSLQISRFIATDNGSGGIVLKRCLFGRDVLYKTTEQLSDMVTKSPFSYMSGVLFITRDDLPSGHGDEGCELEFRKQRFHDFLLNEELFNRSLWKVFVVSEDPITTDDMVVQNFSATLAANCYVFSGFGRDRREDLYRAVRGAVGALIVTPEDIHALNTQVFPSEHHPDNERVRAKR